MHQSARLHLFSVVAFEECLNLLETMYLPLTQEYQLTVLMLSTDVKKYLFSNIIWMLLNSGLLQIFICSISKIQKFMFHFLDL